MRMMLGLALAAVTASGALSADLGPYPLEPDGSVIVEEVTRTSVPRRVVRVKRTVCVPCPGSRLPLGGLRKPRKAQLPLGGLGRYCPPALEVERVVLIRKG